MADPRRVRLTLPVFFAAMLTGCVGASDSSDAAERERLAPYILNSPPKDLEHQSEINYNNKVVLLGYKVTPKEGYKPGSTVKLTMYWQAKADLEEGWSLFTHVLDASGRQLLNIDNVGPLRRWKVSQQSLPPSDWEVGKVYVDEQTFTIPREAGNQRVQVAVGVWKGNKRLKVVSGPHDDADRGLVATLTFQRPPKSPKKKKKRRSPSVPRLRVTKLEEGTKLTIDGSLDEPAWLRAASTHQFVDVKTGRRNAKLRISGRVKVLYDDEAMYLGFNVQDSDIRGGFDKNAKDPHLWTSDAVEIMVDPDGNGDNKDYYEIQINPQNLVFDSRFDSYNKPKGGKDAPFGHEDWSAKLESGVVVSGTLDKASDKDKGYSVEAKIPWKSFDKAKQVPPKPGDTWRMNFYTLESEAAVAWSPILGKGNFHKAKRFGKVTWSGPARERTLPTRTPNLDRSLPSRPRLPLSGALRHAPDTQDRMAPGSSRLSPHAPSRTDDER